MANGVARQSKLWRIAVKPEATVGTYTETGALNLPAIEGWAFTPDRGTGIIARADVTDGRPGAVRGVPGSYGWTLSGEQEIQIEEDTIWMPWVWTLMACGHNADVNVAGGTVALTPTIASIAGYTGGTADQAPCSMSAIVVYDTNGVADGAERARGMTGTAQIMWTAGERMKVAATLKGLVYVVDGASQMIDYGTANLTAVGVWEAQTLPRVATDVVTTFTDLTTSAVLALNDFQEFTLDTGMVNPDISDPADANGLGVSPVFLQDAPSLSMSIAASQANDVSFFAGWRDGRLYSMSTVSGITGSNQITIATPFLQLASAPSRVSADGKDRLQLSFRVVRSDLGDAAAPYTITYKYNAAA